MVWRWSNDVWTMAPHGHAPLQDKTSRLKTFHREKNCTIETQQPFSCFAKVFTEVFAIVAFRCFAGVLLFPFHFATGALRIVVFPLVFHFARVASEFEFQFDFPQI